MLKKSFMLLCIAFVFSGCQGLDNTIPDSTVLDRKEVHTVMQRNIEKIAMEKHSIPEVSDDFVSRYLDMNNLKELQHRTLAGIQITNAEADMTKEEISLWKEMIKNEKFTQYTMEDAETKKQELQGILDALEKDCAVSKEKFLQQYGMTEESISEFIEKQAQKYEQDN